MTKKKKLTSKHFFFPFDSLQSRWSSCSDGSFVSVETSQHVPISRNSPNGIRGAVVAFLYCIINPYTTGVGVRGL